MTPPSLNGLRAISVRLFIMWRGAWIAEVELDPDVVATAPTSGPASLVVGGTTLTGTVDGRGSGSFSGKASARVVGGAGGWDQTVPAQHFHADTGVQSTIVYQATAAAVGETVTVLAPASIGLDFVRSTGPASRVFAGVDWWVDLLGITNVGARPAATADASLVIRDFAPLEQRVEFSCDALLLPNTTLSDPRFNGASPIVRDVEQVYDREGSHGVAWCSSQPVSRLTSALSNFVLEACARTFLRAYRYRLQVYQGNRLALQAVNPQAGVPDLVPVTAWSGVAGVVSKLAPSQEVFLAFDHTTEPPGPIIVGYSLTGLPLTTSIDAQQELDIGPTVPMLKLAGGGAAIGRVGDTIQITQAQLTAATAVAGGNPVTISMPLQGTIASGSAKASSG